MADPHPPFVDYDPEGLFYGTDEELDDEVELLSHLMHDVHGLASIIGDMDEGQFCCGFHGRMVEALQDGDWPDGVAHPGIMDEMMRQDHEYDVWLGGGIQSIFDHPKRRNPYELASLFFAGVARRFGARAAFH